MENINVWRVHVKPDNENPEVSVADYCIENKCICLGWSLKDEDIGSKNINDEIFSERQLICGGSEDESFKKYEDFVSQHKIYCGKTNDNVYRLKNDIKPNDLIWMRNKGIYYIGIVGENSRYKYVCDDFVLKLDSANQRADINWILAGDESEVPGAVTTSFIMGRTLQRINKAGVLEFSQYLVNKECIKNGRNPIFSIKKRKENSKEFFNLISPSDCEDIVCMWLYKKYGYITIPSTNKISTPLYECVLINPNKKSNKEVYIQVKNGKYDLYKSDYVHLGGEVFLFTTEGKILISRDKNVEDNCQTTYQSNGDNMKTDINSIDVNEIFNFVMDDENDNYLPNKIIKWKEFLRSYSM